MLSTIQRLAVAALVIAAALQATPAHAESGWTFYRGTWIPYTVHHHHSAQLAGRALMVTLASEKAAAVRRARRHRDGHLRELERLLGRAYDVLNMGTLPFWLAVQKCEEGPGTAEWATHTASFVGGLGFRVETWRQYAPQAHPPVSASIPAGPFPYSVAQQIAVANAVIAGNGGAYPPWPLPDCSNWHGW